MNLENLEAISKVEQELKRKRDDEERQWRKKIEKENEGIRLEKAASALKSLLSNTEKCANYYRNKMASNKNLATNPDYKWTEPVHFIGQLHQYQKEGLMWLACLYENAINGLLADEMGLGKTIQVIALITFLLERRVRGPFLIVAPLSTLPNWMNEFKKFAPSVPTILFHGTHYDRMSKYNEIRRSYSFDGFTTSPVVLTSYQVTIIEIGFLQEFRWQYLIIDEGHRLKNHQCQLIKKLNQISSLNRLLLTGTPLQNNLTELWSLLNFLMPKWFNDVDVFTSLFLLEDFEEVANMMEHDQYKNVIAMMHNILKPFMLRRLKSDVLKDLVPKKEVLVYCPLSQLQRNLYEWVLKKNIDKLFGKKEENTNDTSEEKPKKRRRCTMKETINKEKINETNVDEVISDSSFSTENKKQFIYSVKLQNPMMMLKRIVNHPYLVHFPIKEGTKDDLQIDESLVQVSGKMLVLDAILPKLKAQGHKVLLFSTMTMVLDFVEEYLLLRDYNYSRFDGTQNLAKREEIVNEFHTDPDIFIMILSTRAGGQGINLTAADTVILYDADWNPQMDVQAQDRCHRIGQKKPVLVFTFVTKGTIDERIMSRAMAKRRLEKVVIRKGKFCSLGDTMKKQNEWTELQELLRSVDHNLVMRSNGCVFSDEELNMLLDRSDLYAQMTIKQEETAEETHNE